MNRTETPHIVAASTLTGDPVRNQEGDDLGTIDEILIDAENGRVAYAVLAAGGFLGIGERYYPIPWEALTVDLTAKEFILNISRARLEKAPGFDKEHWQDMTEAGWRDMVRDFFGLKKDSGGERMLTGGV